ncbi:MAG: hypothetical protein JRI25_25385, partial [Deltaproteobacteria bacterium]|nr:hypothetical protein [Deltaproteobacteria bacterium]
GTIRKLNGLERNQQPGVGEVIRLPDRPGRVTDLPAAVSALAGSGTARIGDAPAVALTLGMAVPTGTEVCLAEGSYATLRLAYDPKTMRHDDVVLMPETCLTVTSSSGGGGARASIVSVHRGSVSIRVTQEPGAVTVLTPAGVITPAGVTSGERGGFRVTIEEEASRTEALEEEVVVIGAGEQVVLEAGYGARVRKGEAPSEPVRLLPPGSPVLPEAGHLLRRPEFVWTPVERALGYQVEFASIEDFTELVYVEEVAEVEWDPDVLFMPFRIPGLWWRVSAFDRTGFVGFPSESRFLSIPPEIGP